MSTTIAYDAIGVNVGTLPGGQHCGYVTGSGSVPWSAAQFVADPSAVRIDQSPVNTAVDETADVLDVENGAATVADIVPWVNAARVNFTNAVRPGQRWPMVYCNRSTLTDVANVLVAGKLTNVPIWLAVPGIPLSSAEADVASADGPYPTYGIQYAWNVTFDADVFLSSWLTNVSGKSGDTITAGAYGPAVQACQARLNVWGRQGGLAVTVDGCFGPVTLAAVHAFQGVNKLTVDGIVGPATWTALNVDPASPAPPVRQVGTVHSQTTGGNAAVTSSDGGWSWKFTGTAPGPWKYQCGTVHSVTTNSDALVVTDDGGLIWHYAGSA